MSFTLFAAFKCQKQTVTDGVDFRFQKCLYWKLLSLRCVFPLRLVYFVQYYPRMTLTMSRLVPLKTVNFHGRLKVALITSSQTLGFKAVS